MPISSLPSPYGIGGFGKGAYDFIDFLAECGQKCWQVLPLNPTSYGDSPYQSPASIAGNPYFIDPAELYRMGLITKAELSSAEYSGKKVDYGMLFNTRYELLRRAFASFKPTAEYKRFIRKNSSWIDDYALFMALKVKYGYKPWMLWDESDRCCESARRTADEHRYETDFWKWVQFEFMREWGLVRDYARSKKIMIIGDMPIYVAHDSMDVWRAPEQFILDECYNPRKVAGVPPDAFSQTGQLWGNPIYNWELMEKDGFKWWIDRIRAAFDLYDILRIDHFRGFAAYFSIPYGHPTAQYGSWEPAPGIALFNKINSVFPKAKIIAEDLGVITPDVRELLDFTGYPGMKVLQFAFDNDDNEYLPRMYKNPNCVAYTGSHDSECTASWAKKLTGEAKRRFRRECLDRTQESGATYSMIELVLASPANLAVIPMQDYLSLKNEEGRINTPSVAEGNWCWRISPRYATDSLKGKIRDLAQRTKRSTR
ncbi:MAG: 4-alpha-glucanotransferase [Ruminococcaceae bacterium]|nr:4-alpha-glucanotransferase [Oscillospiraceae bacterium]